ncbi:hypothetical protein ABZW11_44700 [Nonomuraea sp. NPDC004580]|uniref:hypothetical protein n=1 Tax=Nonomuraea sp. NPDC004580 TaxID=3154552 RepID=UPI0033B88072
MDGVLAGHLAAEGLEGEHGVVQPERVRVQLLQRMAARLDEPDGLGAGPVVPAAGTPWWN